MRRFEGDRVRVVPRRRLAALCVAALCGACSSNAEAPRDEQVATEESAMLGTIAFDPSCTTAPSPQTTPPAVPANITRHLQIGEAYARIAANSPAFTECLQSVMSGPTRLGLPGATWTSGPYYACNGDPTPATTAEVLTSVLSTNGTIISCDFSTIGGSTGGYAGVGNINAAGQEVFSMGNELTNLSAPEDCAYNPDFSACVNDFTYAGTAQIISHEIMHTHGYSHVKDSVWNLNNVNVGDVVGTPPSAFPLTLDDFCGVMPAYTPGNNGIAPTAPTDTPTPGIHPTYGSGIPYEVGQCIITVLEWSAASTHLHDDCGPAYAGLNLVDSVISGTPATATSHCVTDPYDGAAYPSNVPGAPIPPHAPVCVLNPGCELDDPMVLGCSDDNANFVHVESLAPGPGQTWQVDAAAPRYRYGYVYRVCAESLYGRACSALPFNPRPLSCFEPIRLKPIPWWQWQPFTGLAAVNAKIAPLIGGDAMIALPVPAGVVGSYSDLGGAGGDLSSTFGALGVGLFDPEAGEFSYVGSSTGTLPSMIGTAFAMAVGADGLPHLIGFGGATDKGAILANVYDGALTTGKTTSTNWTRTAMPDARTHMSVIGSLSGGTVYSFGGRTSQTVVDDLRTYDVAKGVWSTFLSHAASARVDAAMATDGATLAIFGGSDAKGNLLGDLNLVDLGTGKMRTATTAMTPRANAALAIQNGYAYAFGGTGAAGATGVLEVVSLTDGKPIYSSDIGASASSGSAIGLDDIGSLLLIPGAVPGSQTPGGAFVGPLDALMFVSE